jgi:hypothetical protein
MHIILHVIYDRNPQTAVQAFPEEEQPFK